MENLQSPFGMTLATTRRKTKPCPPTSVSPFRASFTQEEVDLKKSAQFLGLDPYRFVSREQPHGKKIVMVLK
jgi:hypothetical protein